MPISHRVRLVTTSIVTLILAGCASGGARAPSATAGPSAACALVIPEDRDPASLGASDTAPGAEAAPSVRNAAPASTRITVALSEPVDPSDAPWPRNESERLVFAQLYEPLVRLDCTGRVVPGLARRWSADSSHTRWTFVLREGASFRGGGAVTAAAVIEGWRRSAAAHAGAPAGATIARIAASARALDAATIFVSVPGAPATPEIFASASLAVARATTGHGWPDGTTSYDVEPGTPPADGSAGSQVITLRPTHGSLPALSFQVAGGEDPRDIIDAGVDVLPAAPSAVAQYAATQRGRTVIPLAWNRTYALALPSRASGSSAAATPARPACESDGARAFRTALASAVHADARGAERPFWWEDDGERAGGGRSHASPCPARGSDPSPGGARDADVVRVTRGEPGRIVYHRDDATARELAERIVALAAPGRGTTPSTGLASVAPEMLGTANWRAVGLDSANFSRALAAGTEQSYILALPRRPVAPILASAALVAAAPWLGSLDRPGAPIVPLVDTRVSLIARRRSVPMRLMIDWDATLRFDAAPSPNAEGTP